MIGINIWFYTAVPILALMIAIWVISLILKNASIVDIFWGLGFVIVFWFTYMRTPLNHQLKTTLLGVIVTVWGFRLAVHILLRSIGKARMRDMYNFASIMVPIGGGPVYLRCSYYKDY